MSLEEMRECRRFFHQIPEPGWLEFQTTINIIKRLKEIGYEVRYGQNIHGGPRMGLPSEEKFKKYGDAVEKDVNFDISEILEGFTGAVVTLDTGNPGPKFGFRFDIDALEITESTDPSHIPFSENFRSRNENAMHACGHDGHITIGLSLAKWLMENKDKLKGKYVIVFQPAEEGVRGAKSMVNTNKFNDIDYFFGLHLGINLPSGKVGVGSENIFATSKLDIGFTGLSSHAGGAPEEGKNALLAAASAALNFHTIPQHSKGMSRINVGTFTAGSGRNIVPDSARLQVEVRGESSEIVSYLINRVDQIAKGSATQYDLDYDIKEVGSALSMENHDFDFYEEISNLLEDKEFDVVRGNKFSASEDVTYFFNRVNENGGKAMHILVGSNIKAGHHNEKFDFNEEDLVISFQVLKEIILHLQNR